MKRNGKRLVFLSLFFFFWLAAILGRLFYWQVLAKNHFYDALVDRKENKRVISAARGKIYSRDGFPLVSNKIIYSLFLWRPALRINLSELFKKVSPIIFYPANKENQEKKELLKKVLHQPAQKWIALAQNLNYGQYQALHDLHLSGLQFQLRRQRFYPEGSMAAHLLGFVGRDELGQPRGYFGLEGFYQEQLAGLMGVQQSGFWHFLNYDNKDVAPRQGRDLYLFLDRGVQFIADQALAAGVHRYGAKGGWVVILDSRSGAILALATWPKYDPSRYEQYSYQRFLDPVISASFEPGSIFKPLVMAAALNESVVKPESRCPCQGPIRIGKYEIKTWNEVYHPNSTMTDIIKNSDNVGMVYVARQLGAKKLFAYLQRYHLTKKTGIDLQGEMLPLLKSPDHWYPIDLATISFGQGIAVTPIQFITAFNALADGGVVYQPRVVARIVAGHKVFFTRKHILGRPLKAQTCREIKEMLVTAVNEGEAKWTRLSGYKIAGKTGTAQIPLKGHYAKKKTIASFAGFAPADNPRFTMLVSLQEPISSPWGSETAAPLWFQIARQLFTYWGIQPQGS